MHLVRNPQINFIAALAVLLAGVTLAAAFREHAFHPKKQLVYAARKYSRTSTVPSDGMGLPAVVLWAWERAEDARFLNPGKQGVAFLARTIELHSLPPGTNDDVTSSVVPKPRLQPLAVAPGTPLMAVVRIETSNDLWHRSAGLPNRGASPVSYSEAQRNRVATLIADTGKLHGVKAVQIDFDASEGERSFYSALLEEVRAELPRGMPLSITALASWCIGDTWLDRLPPGTIDEAVPMLFRMGPDASSIANYLKSGGQFRSSLCDGSIGVSTDEGFSRALLTGDLPFRTQDAWQRRRIYVFSPQSWTRASGEAVAEEIGRWHE